MTQEIRQKALQGLYVPESKTTFCFITPDGDNGLNAIVANSEDGNWEPYRKEGYVFFPTPEIREEYKLIGEEKWLPKKGDLVFGFITHSLELFELTAHEDFTEGLRHNSIYAPSAEQRSAFIAKRKGEEPKGFQHSEDLRDYAKINMSDKPRIIEICISNEAIERAINILQGPVSEQEIQDLKDNARQFIALLHLEATLSK